jgi:phage RecT family recombinase
MTVAKTNTPARQPAPGPPAQASAPARPPKTIRDILEECVDRIATVLPKHLTPDRMISLVSNIVYRTPRLQECDPYSIVSSVQQASALGLDLMPTMGEAYLVPVWNKKLNNGHGGYECQFRPGYQGLAKLARNAGVVYIKAILVRAADIFDHRYTPDLVFLHVPHRGPDRGDVCDVYCVAKLPTGEHLIEVMNTDEIEAIHRRSESFIYASKNDKAEFGPWVSDWGEMAKKTVLKRLTKSLPKSPELAEAIEADNRDYPDDPRPNIPLPDQRLPARRGVAGLRQQLELDEPVLPPQPTRTYSEADDVPPDPGDAADGPGGEEYSGEGAGDDAREG